MKDENRINRMIETSNKIEAKLVKAEIIIQGAMAKETRDESFKKFKDDSQNLTQEETILKFLKTYGRHTRRQIEEATGIRTSSASARLNSLVKQGLIVESAIVECQYTQKRVVLYSALTDVE